MFSTNDYGRTFRDIAQAERHNRNHFVTELLWVYDTTMTGLCAYTTNIVPMQNRYRAAWDGACTVEDTVDIVNLASVGLTLG